jgi:hypothetical protein
MVGEGARRLDRNDPARVDAKINRSRRIHLRSLTEGV